MNVTVLVDFENDSVQTALEVAEALGDDLWGVRLDTSDTLARRVALATGMGDDGADRRRPASWSGSCARALDEAGHGGRPDRRLRRLHAERIRAFEAARRAGRRLRRRLVADPRRERLHRRRRRLEGRPRAKVGRRLNRPTSASGAWSSSAQPRPPSRRRLGYEMRRTTLVCAFALLSVRRPDSFRPGGAAASAASRSNCRASSASPASCCRRATTASRSRKQAT